jgi:hypothetical protein
MNELESAIDEIALGAIQMLREPELEFLERELAVNLLESCITYFKRKITNGSNEGIRNV